MIFCYYSDCLNTRMYLSKIVQKAKKKNKVYNSLLMHACINMLESICVINVIKCLSF